MGSIFFGLGAVTVFMDFISTPVVSMGLPLIALIVIKRDKLGQLGAGKAAGYAPFLLQLSGAEEVGVCGGSRR